MGSLAACTIAAKRDLSLGRVVANSFLEHHPGIPFFLLLADEVEDCFQPENEPYRMIRLDDLAIPRPRQFRFHYSAQEVSYAVTPYLIAHLLEQGFSRVIFIKQESLVLGDLSPAFDRLDDHSAVLTSHLLTPLSGQGAARRDLDILLAGTYNGGFLAFADTQDSRQFLSWWQDRVYRHCVHSVGAAMHFEQRWLDFAPVFIQKVHISRDPGLNVGHWNLPEREVRMDGAAVLADGLPCRLFRFSGFDPERPEAVTRYSGRLTMENVGAAASVFRHYLSRLNEAGYRETRAWPYAYSHFDNGVPIPAEARRIYREMGEEVESFGDPFETVPAGSYYRWMNAPCDHCEEPREIVSRFWQSIYRTRRDLQEAFPDPLGRDRTRFLKWTVESGSAEHGVSPRFLAHTVGSRLE